MYYALDLRDNFIQPVTAEYASLHCDLINHRFICLFADTPTEAMDKGKQMLLNLKEHINESYS